MTPERWKQIEDVFQAALDLSPDERGRFMREACAGDDLLRAHVEELIGQYEKADSFIEAPAYVRDLFQVENISVPTTLPLEDENDPMAGRRIGAYRIVREIGRGGMGAVYMAWRADSEFQKRVAIKLVKRGMDTDFILRRFRNERQILASLDHPNIARLLDGGTTEDGLPYFVMEYIDGQPLYTYCDEQQLTIAERLRLFCQACNAAHYAHQHFVIHRDIKPGNILVTADGTLKLLDFGIAKLLNPELTPETLPLTLTAMRLMTPEYASPEQVQGLPATPASDIYALGVMLYELLTGHRPYHFRNRLMHEIARVICEEEPLRPSIAIGRIENMLRDTSALDKETMRLESLCRNRGGTSESLRRELAGDLDNIILKAMAKEPQRRYHSVEHLCEDITRHLEGSPIHAPSYFTAAIKSSKSSNPLSAEPTAGDKTFAVLPFRTLSALTADETDGEYLGLGLADALITRLSKIQRIAVRPTSSVARYSNPTFDPFTAGYELGVNFVLDGRIQRVAERIRVTVQLLNVRDGAAVWAEQFDENFTDVLTLQDIISAEVAEALVPQLTSDERLQLAKRGTDSAEAFEAYLRGRYYWNTFTEEGFARAITQFYRAVALDPSYAAAHTGIADYYNWLGIYGVLPPAECFAAAKEAALKAIELDSTLAEAYTALGFATACYDFDWATAEAHYRRAIELNPNYATARQWYCFHLLMIGHFNEAIAEIRQALEIDPLSSSFRQALGWSYYQARRYDESIIEHRKLIAMDSGFALGRFSFTWPLLQKGMREQAIAEARKAVELSGGSPFMLAGLGSAYARAGKKDEAHAVLRELNELSAKRYVSPYHVAIIHCNLGDADQALALLEQTYVNRDAWLIWLSVEPQLDPLRADPRFVDLLQRVYPPNEDETKIAVANANREARDDSNIRDEHIPAMRDTEIARRGRLLPTSRWPLIASVAMIACLLAVIFFYFRSSNGTINRVRSGEPVRLTNNLSFNIQPDWSPDGNQIVFASNREGHYQIYVMNADGANTTRLTYNLTDDSMPAWSPDGRRIAFTSKRDGDDEVYVMNADGSNQTNLSRNRAADSRPAWSPDGKRIAFVSNRDAERNAYDIYVMDADGKDQTRLTNDSHLNSDPAWSPDGQKIAFVSNRTGNFEIYTMGADGSNPKNITNNPAFDGKPAWSPDGARIAFTSNRSNGNFNIYVINADGSNARNVTANTVIDDEPAWSPNGSKIVYQSEYNGNFEIYTINVAAALRVKALANNTTRAPSIAVLPSTTNAR